MELSILFWFYKRLDVCENRLRLLKRYNPGLKVFGLFGGSAREAGRFDNALGGYLDDFYLSPFKSSRWKWLNGDLVLLDWYDQRGRHLDWDSVAVIQWDTLVFDFLPNQFSGVKKDEIFLYGLKDWDRDSENSWCWTKPGSLHRSNYLKFLRYIEKRYGYTDKPLGCLFILEVFPRLFFERYLTVENRKVGMLEYKIPTYAKIFGLSFYKKYFGGDGHLRDEYRFINALKLEIKREHILEQLSIKEGRRIFHPYHQAWTP